MTDCSSNVPAEHAVLEDALEYSLRYLSALPTRSVAPDVAAVDRLARRANPQLQSSGVNARDVLREIDDLASPATMAMTGPRFFGFVIGGTLPVAMAAHWLATAWDQNVGLYRWSPGPAHLEAEALRWLLQVLRLPAECAGGFTTGTAVAHVVCLAAARRAMLAREGWDVDEDGLAGSPPITVVVSEESHPTLFKALGVLGLGRRRVVAIPTDSQGRMNASAMPRLTGPVILCTQVGNVNTGSCDPVADIIDRVRSSGTWVHVDGAFGLWARATRAHAHLVEGVDAADSWAIDAHKWLNVPYDTGVAIVRDGDASRRSMSIGASYLPTDSAFRNPSDYVLELGRRARGVDVWAALRCLGTEGVARIVEQNCRQAERLAEGMRAAGYEVLNDVVLNQVLVKFGDPERTRRIVRAIQADGTLWAGDTEWQGQTAMRVSVCSHATTDADIDRSIATIVQIAAEEHGPVRYNAGNGSPNV